MKIRHFLIIFAMLCATSLGISGEPSAQAMAPMVVNTLEDVTDSSCIDGTCSLRDAIYLVPDDAAIEFSVTGTIFLTQGELKITRDMMFHGPGVNLLTIDGGNASRVFYIDQGEHVDIFDLTIAHGSADNGGGIYNLGTLTLMNCTLYANTATQDGGGIYNRYNYGRLEVKACSFLDNQAAYGGGLKNESATASLWNTTFKGNIATNRGGGVDSGQASGYPLSSLEIRNSTFSGNIGGGIANPASTTTALNTIVAGNTDFNCSGEFEPGTTNFNLTSDGTCTPGFFPASFASIKLNWQGWVFELLPGSVAVDRGVDQGCLSTDQLGNPRPEDGNGDDLAVCDIGAYELAAPPPPAVSLFLPLTVK